MVPNLGGQPAVRGSLLVRGSCRAMEGDLEVPAYPVVDLPEERTVQASLGPASEAEEVGRPVEARAENEIDEGATNDDHQQTARVKR